MRYFVADAHCDRLMHSLPAPDITPGRLKRGGVALQVFALFAGILGPAGDPYAVVRNELAVFYRLTEASCADGWELRQTKAAYLPADHTAAMLSIEGGECLQGSLTRLYEFAALGVRMIALTWNHENEIGYPSKYGGAGLKPFGKRLLREMASLHIAADVSHLSEKGFWDVEAACGPFMATHSNAKVLCDCHRNLTDEQIKAIIRHNGFIGVNFLPAFLNGSLKEGGAAIDDIVRHIDHMMQLGGENVIGFGSDFDGITEHSAGATGPDCFPAILEALERQNYPEAVLRRIAGDNLVSFLNRV